VQTGEGKNAVQMLCKSFTPPLPVWCHHHRRGVIIIDEAHHFRNPGIFGTGGEHGRIAAADGVRPSRYRQLFDLIERPDGNVKQLFLLTATPINNKLIDLQHMIELFSRRKPDYFKTTLGIHSLPGHFRRMEKELSPSSNGQHDLFTEISLLEADKVLAGDKLFQGLVVQRSRAYVRQSQLQQGGTAGSFPTREDPKVADYSIKKTYGRLLQMVDQAFHKEKPLFSLAMYYPLPLYQGSDTTLEK